MFAGDAVLNSAQTIATASEGWPTLGVSATSDDGQVIAFGADRGDGDGLFLSWLGSSGFTDPIPLLGENASSPAAELGTDSAGSPLYLTDIDMQEPIEVIRRESGAPGLADDTAVVVFRATPNAAGDHFSDQPGLWSVIVHFAGTGDAGTPIVAVPETPAAVAQLGDPMGAETVTSIGIHDPLGAGTGTGNDDHQVVYRLASASTQQIVRATWDGPLELPLGAALTSGTAGLAPALQSTIRSVATSAFAARPTPAAAPTPVAVPAFTIADTTPPEGAEVTVTNRSRWTDGTPMEAEFDPGDGSTGGTFSADGSAQWAWPDPGPVTASMSVDSGATSAAIDLVVQAPSEPGTDGSTWRPVLDRRDAEPHARRIRLVRPRPGRHAVLRVGSRRERQLRGRSRRDGRAHLGRDRDADLRWDLCRRCPLRHRAAGDRCRRPR